MRVHLHGKQTLATKSDATEILYGGAAGGGKSFLMRALAIMWCMNIPGLQVYLFRRTHPDLIKNHLNGAGSFYELLGDAIQEKLVDITTQPAEIRFKNGSKIHLCHCNHEKDVYNYQGAEINVLLMDELTHFTEFQYRYLRGRVRLGGLEVPPEYKGRFPRVLAGSNPGGTGHAFVKRTFVDYCQPYEIKQTEDEEGGFKRQFIPALLEDNPTMAINDPNYEKALAGLGSPEFVRALRYGDWDITAGSAFEKLRRDTHMIRPFTPPKWWTKFMVIDWGTAKPFAVGWFCVCDDDLILKAKDDWPEMLIPKGSMIAYREYYGWSGKPDEGCRMESWEVAQRIIEMEDEHNEDMDYRIGDSAMWSQVDGPSVADRMYEATDGQLLMRKSKKDRINNYQEMRARIAGEGDGPMFYATSNCQHFWRTVPDLQLDNLHPEKGYDTSQEDHWADVFAYACADRPMIKTRQDRMQEAWDEAESAAGMRKGKSYGTR